MANIKSAKKRIEVIKVKTALNKARKSEIKTYITKFNKALENGDIDSAKALLKIVEKKLSRASAKNTIHKNAAARKVSRLAKRLNQAV
ncbi:SSU ribosomal protein S20P [Proteiniborus ethanoligenes]|uniref:Small ribosomal subunit protein bS20 n=1 Tax=Proteiniborus ethanoligenes TaxID=415015 RepID=A0A1H3R1K9_9FIRM|nr:30S ribosomal protein S20 [Proteiniborus ethanoligenes]TAH62867.1 MAG: 30S ribosomal protein S20 [Gottschalkiaceae bacterium]SDZ19486.1 SSU ribosomal protein S20P [Proteiniborus ethanoligenes]